MRLIDDPVEVGGQDLTARARIRDAAIALFGQAGFAETTVRAIAADADVSAGLVIHHFGGKDGLREACDDRVVDLLRAKREAMGEQSPGPLDGLGAYGLYLARMISDGTSAGNDLFDRLVDESEAFVLASTASGMMRRVAEPRDVAIVLTMQSLAPLLLHSQLSRPDQRPSPDSLSAVARVTAEIYTHGLFTDEHLVNAVEGASR